MLAGGTIWPERPLRKKKSLRGCGSEGDARIPIDKKKRAIPIPSRWGGAESPLKREPPGEKNWGADCL